jgi:hypothetical protein
MRYFVMVMVTLLLCNTASAQLFRRRTSGNYYNNSAAQRPAMRPTTMQQSTKYVDEKDLPAGAPFSDPAVYPHIVIDGQKLDYDAEKNYYVLAGTDQRAIWLTYKDVNTGKTVRTLGKQKHASQEGQPLPDNAPAVVGSLRTGDGKTVVADGIAAPPARQQPKAPPTVKDPVGDRRIEQANKAEAPKPDPKSAPTVNKEPLIAP